MRVPFVRCSPSLGDKLSFHLIEALFESDRVRLWIDETFDASTQVGKLILRLLANLGQRWRLVHGFPCTEHRHQEVDERRTVRDRCVLGWVDWIHHGTSAR